MLSTKSNLQLQYEGFQMTPVLWKEEAVSGMEQFEITHQIDHPYHGDDAINQRLGKRIEQFVFHDLSHSGSIDVLAKNLQIKDGKLTIGELDALIKHKEEFIHLEIIYKFYLYDENVGKSTLDHWIGPNRNDSLIKKLIKLQMKQLPLLFHSETLNVLKKLNLSPPSIQQKVLFKAQLFVPLKLVNNSFPIINNACTKGFYIRLPELKQLKGKQFYIPGKLDWLMEPHETVEWLNVDQFYSAVSELLAIHRSPLCWCKEANGNMEKFFVVWWD